MVGGNSGGDGFTNTWRSRGVVLTVLLTTGSKHQVTWTIGANWQRTVSEHDPFSPNVLTWASLITSIVFTGHN